MSQSAEQRIGPSFLGFPTLSADDVDENVDDDDGAGSADACTKETTNTVAGQKHDLQPHVRKLCIIVQLKIKRVNNQFSPLIRNVLFLCDFFAAVLNVCVFLFSETYVAS